MCLRVFEPASRWSLDTLDRAIEDREQMCVKRGRIRHEEMIMIARELLRKTRLSRLGNHHPSQTASRKLVPCGSSGESALALSFPMCWCERHCSQQCTCEQNKVKKRRKRVICFCLASSLCLGFALTSCRRRLLVWVREAPFNIRSRCFCSS